MCYIYRRMKKQKLNKTQKEILSSIEKYWENNPQLRFCQLLQNIEIIQRIAISGGFWMKDNFLTEDAELLERMNKWL